MSTSPTLMPVEESDEENDSYLRARAAFYSARTDVTGSEQTTHSNTNNKPVAGEYASSSSSSSSTSSTSPTENKKIDDEKGVRLFFFTWNSESIRIAEAVKKSGQEPISMISEYWLRCEQPDFLPELLKMVFTGVDNETCKYDFLVFGLQESCKPGDYFHNAISNELGNRYTLLRRQRMLGVGKTTWTSMVRDWELKLRGVRIAVYVRTAFLDRVALLGDVFVPCLGRERITHGKGAVGVVVRVVDIGVIAFLNVHLVFDSTTLAGTNHERIRDGVAKQNAALNYLIDSVREQYRGIHYFFLMGDLNYRVLHLENHVDARAMHRLMAHSEENRRRLYETQDELRNSINYGALPPFQEGVDGRGPCFMPTAKLERNRVAGDTNADAYKFGKLLQRNPSWCDRILFATHRELDQTERPHRLRSEFGRVIDGDGDVECLYYDRFESGKTMCLSDHAAVVAAFKITPFLGGDAEEEEKEGDERVHGIGEEKNREKER